MTRPTLRRHAAALRAALLITAAAPTAAHAQDVDRACREPVGSQVLVKARRNGDRFDLLDAVAHPAGGAALLVTDGIRRGTHEWFVERIDASGGRTSIPIPLDTANNERPLSLGVDAAGDYVVSLTNTGAFPTRSGTEDYFVLKFDAAADVIWRAQVAAEAASGSFDDLGLAVRADGGASVATALTIADDVEFAVASVAPDGTLEGTFSHRVTQASLGGRVQRRVRRAVFDESGNPHFLVGDRNQTRMRGLRLELAGEVVTTFDYVIPNDSQLLERALTVSPNGNVTLFAADVQAAGDDGLAIVSASFAPDGTALWVRRRESEFERFVAAAGVEHAASDAASRVFVTGELAERGSAVGTVAYDAAGNELWSAIHRAAAPGIGGTTTGRRVVPRGDGGAFVLGTSETNLVLEYDATGTLVWSHEFGGRQGLDDGFNPLPDDGVALVRPPGGGVLAVAETFSRKLRKGGIEVAYHGDPTVVLGGIAKVRGRPLSLGTAKANRPVRTKGLKIKNKSRTACLRVGAVTSGAPFDVRPALVLIPPGAVYVLQVAFDSDGVLIRRPTGRLRLTTSDPAAPTIDIDLRARVK